MQMAPRIVVVAHDLSAPADRALAFALGLARQVGARVEVVHVHPDLFDGRSTPAVGLPWPSEDQEERYLRFLDGELAARIERAGGPAALEQTRRHVVRGLPQKRICELAGELSADLVCVGATGKRAIDRVLLGSVSQLLVRTSPVPVLVVP
jgi:nucleotide-binding universal stress UspA family protein